MSTKTRQIIKIKHEFTISNTNSYDISGLDITLLKLFYREPQQSYVDLASGDYTITVSNNTQILVLQNQDIIDVAESIQACYLYDITSSEYDASFEVDINTLKDNYNQAVADLHVLWKYVRDLGFSADDDNFSIILPQLDEGEVWVKTEDSWRGFYIGDIENQVKELRKLIENSRVSAIKDIENKRDESLEDVKEEGDTQVERVKTTGADRITEQGDFQVNRVKETGDTKNEMLITTGNTQNTKVKETGDTQNSRVITTGNNKVDDVTEEGRVQVDRVTETGNTEVSKVTTEGTKRIGLLNSSYDGKLEAIEEEGDSQFSRVTSEGNNQVSRVTTEGNTQVARIKSEGDTQNTRIISTANDKMEELDNYGVFNKEELYPPVGSCILLDIPTNPAELYLNTIWQKIEGKYIKTTSGSGASSQTGGSNTKTLSIDNMPSHNHTASQSAHTHTQPAHIHGGGAKIGTSGGGASTGGGERTGYKTESAGGENTGTASPSISIGYAGSGTSFNIEPAYITLHLWKRIS